VRLNPDISVPASAKFLENPSFLLVNSPFFGTVFWVKYVRLPRQHFVVNSPVFFFFALYFPEIANKSTIFL